MGALSQAAGTIDFNGCTFEACKAFFNDKVVYLFYVFYYFCRVLNILSSHIVEFKLFFRRKLGALTISVQQQYKKLGLYDLQVPKHASISHLL